MERAKSPNDINGIEPDYFSFWKTTLQNRQRLVVIPIAEGWHHYVFIADVKIGI
jgi:hypothetical protein